MKSNFKTALEEIWIEKFWVGSVSLLAGFFALYLGAMILFHLGTPLTIWHSTLFILPVVGVCQLFLPGRHGLAVTGIVASAIFVIATIFMRFQDFSWDGMAVRQGCVESMVGGATPRSMCLPHVISGWLAILCGSIPGGKGVNLIAGLAAFGCLLKLACRIRIPSGWNWVLPIAVTMNPVFIYQLNSFYIDGFTSCLLVCLACGFFLVYEKPLSHRRWLFLAVIIFLTAASKPSGIVYCIIYGSFFLGGLAISKKWKPQYILVWPLIGGILMMIGLVSLKMQRGEVQSLYNFREFANLRTPGYGIGLGSFAPDSAAEMSKIEVFFRSHFAPTRTMSSEWEFKVPGWFARPELALFQDLNPDPRSGGFGPLYGAVFLLAALAAGVTLVYSPRSFWVSWIPALGLFVSCLLSQAWWARWVPQAWLVPLALVAPVLIRTAGRVAGWLAKFSVTLALLNSILILAFYTSGCFQNQNILNQQLMFLKELPQPISVYVPTFPSNLTWMQEAGIPFVLLKKEPLFPRLTLQRTNTKVALPDNWESLLPNSRVLPLWEKRRLIEK